MATVNLGSIKFKWKGTYSGATAYTVDDVVSYNGSSYICILASTGNLPTNATYFEQMSSAGTNGTNGTDLTTTLTTQGDILYRDGSGLQRLGAGTSGQALITGGAGANPSWGTVAGGKILQVVQSVKSDTGSWSGTETRTDTGLQASITPSATSSKILITGSINIGFTAANNQYFIHLDRGGTEIGQGDTAGARKFCHTASITYSAIHQGFMTSASSVCFLDSPNTTSATVYKIQHSYTTNGSTFYINRSVDDREYTAYDARTSSNITLMEIGA